MTPKHLFSGQILTVVLVAQSLALLLAGQNRSEVTIVGPWARPESLTSSQDGTMYMGGSGNGMVYRAAPGSAQAEPWIDAATHGLSYVLGVFADDRANTLWVCSNRTGGRNGAPVTGEPALYAFDLATAARKGRYPFPGGGLCNDIAIASDGTAYISDSNNARVLRLRPGAAALDVWLADPRLAVVDGVAILADGALYVNTYITGKLFRIPVAAGGAAGPLVEVVTSMPFDRPDGLRAVGRYVMLQTEWQGRLTEITITGDRAEVRVLREGLTDSSAVTLVGNTAFALVDLTKAVAVPYTPPSTSPR